MSQTLPFDDTEAKRALAQRMFDEAPVLLCTIDIVARRFVAHNRALASVLSGADGDNRTFDLAAVIFRISREQLQQAAAHFERLKAARDGDMVKLDLRARDGKGEERVFALSCSVFSRGADGAPREVLIAATDVTEERRRTDELQRSEALFQAFLDHMPATMYVKDGDYRYLLANRKTEELLRLAPGGVVGKTDDDLFPPEAAAMVKARDDEVRDSGMVMEFEDTVPIPGEKGGLLTYLSVKFPIRGHGIPDRSMAGASIDITIIKQAEAEREAAREAIIAAQEATIRELATPLLPIADGVLVVPLIGLIDPARASRIIEGLLEGIGQHQASIAIIDITGVKSVDGQVAELLLQAARAVGLLGAKVVLTGIQPAIARTLIELGVDWQGVVTEATLRGGIAYALKHRTRRR